MTILVLLLALLVNAGDSTLTIWSKAKGQISSFQSARDAFDAMTRKLSQATLNTYWGYDDPANPTQYERRSELQFISGPAVKILGADYGSGHAVFFQSPLGFSEDSANRPLNQLLNSCGFYIAFGDDSESKPGFVGSPNRWRHRLMELVQPTETLSIHEKKGTPDWYKVPIDGGNALPVADNIIALIIRPLRPAADDPSADRNITKDYLYDTSVGKSTTTPTANQLPPLLGVTLVAIDEASAIRFDQGSTPPVWFSPTLFQDTVKYAEHLGQIESGLADKHVNFRTFSTEVALPGSKWSE